MSSFEPDILSKKSVLTDLEYHTSVPTEIPNFGIHELSYRGSMWANSFK